MTKVIDEISNPEDYRGFRIQHIHAITAIDPNFDDEGIGGYMTRNGPVPMIASDDVRLEKLIEMAQEMSNQTGTKFKVVRFSIREDLQEIVPQNAQS